MRDLSAGSMVTSTGKAVSSRFEMVSFWRLVRLDREDGKTLSGLCEISSSVRFTQAVKSSEGNVEKRFSSRQSAFKLVSLDIAVGRAVKLFCPSSRRSRARSLPIHDGRTSSKFV